VAAANDVVRSPQAIIEVSSAWDWKGQSKMQTIKSDTVKGKQRRVQTKYIHKDKSTAQNILTAMVREPVNPGERVIPLVILCGMRGKQRK
jgi:hypothetical protein